MAPFLLCDPISGVTQYQVDITPPSPGVPSVVTTPAQADGSLKYDASGLTAVGKYTFTLRNADVSGFWSTASSPLSATRYNPPANLRFASA
jgi:hypothetical protein